MFKVLQERTDLGALIENLVFLNLDEGRKVNYHKDNLGEIDFITDGIGIEVKYKDILEENDLRSLKDKRGLKKRIVVTRSTDHSPDQTVEAIPLWKFLKRDPIST